MSWGYRPSLDGLRMLAMYLIVLFHANVAGVEGSFIAVNLFFVLSGFLVTNVILTEMDRTGSLDLGQFYARRVRRLLPAAVVAIVGISVLFLLVSPVVRRVSIIGDAQSALLYVANWRFIHQGNDYFASGIDKSPFLHFWTLGIEEQFYLLFPLVVLLLVRRRWRWALLGGLSAIFLLSVGAQLYWANVNELRAYFGTDARLYQLVAGALLAIAMRTWTVRLPARAAGAVASTGMVSFLLLSTSWIDLSQASRGFLGTAACVLLIGGLMLAEDQPLGRLLSRRTPVYLGKISYSTYLWHWPAILVLQQMLTVGPLTIAVIAAVLATALAAASAELIEDPIRRSKSLNPFRWRVVGVGLAVSVLVAVAVVPGVLSSPRAPALAAATTPKAQTAPSPEVEEVVKGAEPVPEDVDWTEVDKDRGETYTCGPENPEDCVVVEGPAPHVLVVGDSHGRMLSKMFTTLAEERDFTLSMNVVMGCPWQENLRKKGGTPKGLEECEKARVGWYDEVMPQLEPDVVVLVSFPRDNEKWTRRIEHRDGIRGPLEKKVLRATKQNLRKIERQGARALMVQSLIMPEGFRPNDCLTGGAKPEECAVPMPAEQGPSDAFYRALAAESPNLYSVNLNPAFCPTAPVCRAVHDGKVVWRDPKHFTAGFAEDRRDRVWKLIRRTGVLTDSVSS
ncbi:MAG TPA: acyltransferase family protein [Nocardioidaceae bacterium]|nr:acyltransferase family protein [Nocardioidaceae bacterium]